MRVTTVDGCTQDWPRVDVVKIDVQGYEFEVMLGMRRVLASNPNMMLVTKFWPWGMRRAGADPHAFLACGFSLWEAPEGEPVRPIPASALASHVDGVGEFTNILCARADEEG